MRNLLLLLTVSVCAEGCTHRSLQRSVLRQSSTINEIYFQQVVDNIAQFHVEPNGLPQFAMVTDGTSQLADSGTATNTIGWVPKGFSSNSLTLSANRQLMGNWKMTPTIALASRMRRMRCAFQLVASSYPTGFSRSDGGLTLTSLENEGGFGVLCVREMQDYGLLPKPTVGKDNVIAVDSRTYAATFATPEDADSFELAFESALVKNFPRCWYHVGGRKDVPKCACFTSEYCRQHVWVDVDGMDALSRFTLNIVAIATVDPQSKSPATVQVKRKFSNGEEEWELVANVEEREVFSQIRRLATAEVRRAQEEVEAADLQLNSTIDAIIEKAGKEHNGLKQLLGPTEAFSNLDSTPEAARQKLKEISFDKPEEFKKFLTVAVSTDLRSDFDKRKQLYNEAKTQLREATQRLDFASVRPTSSGQPVSPFDLTPTLPLSRSSSGIEFVPSVPSPQ